MAKVTKPFMLNNVLASYVKIAEADSYQGSEPSYSIQLVLEPDHKQLKELQKLIGGMIQEAFDKKIPREKWGLRSMDDEGKDTFPGHWFINAKKKEKFGRVPVFDQQATPVEPTSEVLFSGCRINAQVSLYSYDFNGIKGVGCGLTAVQIVDNVNVDRLDGGADVNNLFQPVEGAPTSSPIPQVAPAAAPVKEGEEIDIPW